MSTDVKTIYTHTCDMCGKQVNDKHELETLLMRDARTPRYLAACPHVRLDVCRRCRSVCTIAELVTAFERM